MIPWRRKWQFTPVFLPGKSHGQRSLAGYNPWGSKESHRTERLNRNNMYLYLSSLKRKDTNEQDLSYSCQAFCNITSLKPPRQSHEETGGFAKIRQLMKSGGIKSRSNEPEASVLSWLCSTNFLVILKVGKRKVSWRSSKTKEGYCIWLVSAFVSKYHWYLPGLPLWLRR